MLVGLNFLLSVRVNQAASAGRVKNTTHVFFSVFRIVTRGLSRGIWPKLLTPEIWIQSRVRLHVIFVVDEVVLGQDFPLVYSDFPANRNCTNVL
jgi:hypothetical protein